MPSSRIAMNVIGKGSIVRHVVCMWLKHYGIQAEVITKRERQPLMYYKFLSQNGRALNFTIDYPIARCILPLISIVYSELHTIEPHSNTL